MGEFPGLCRTKGQPVPCCLGRHIPRTMPNVEYTLNTDNYKNLIHFCLSKSYENVAQKGFLFPLLFHFCNFFCNNPQPLRIHGDINNINAKHFCPFTPQIQHESDRCPAWAGKIMTNLPLSQTDAGSGGILRDAALQPGEVKTAAARRIRGFAVWPDGESVRPRRGA